MIKTSPRTSKLYYFPSYRWINQRNFLKRKNKKSFFSLIFSLIMAFFIILVTAKILNLLEQNLKRQTLNFFSIKTVLALDRELYKAIPLIRSHDGLSLNPGKSFTFTAGFKNTGKEIWQIRGNNFISLYAEDQKFRHKFWFTPEQPAKLKNITKPGEIGYFTFAIEAPLIPGKYLIKLRLAAEDLTWIEGGKIEIPVNVEGETYQNVSNSHILTESNIFLKEEDWSAMKLIQTVDFLSLSANEEARFTVGFKNTGKEIWPANIVTLNSTNQDFKANAWNGEIAAKLSSLVKPGELALINFSLKAPAVNLSQNLQFNLKVNNQLIPGGVFNLPLQVLGAVNNSNSALASSQSFPECLSIVTGQNNCGVEPKIRVGLYSIEGADIGGPIKITANQSYEIRDGNNKLLSGLPAFALSQITFDFNSKVYTINVSGSVITSFSYLKFISPNSDVVFEITNYESRPGWNKNLNDNKFRESLEIRQSDKTKKLWVINELPMEKYLWGLAESSNNSPLEYQKALVVTARTYALYSLKTGGKYTQHNFTLTNTDWDQVYRGYNSEIRMPRLTQAVNETRGQIVSYNNEVVITPYFSRSDGRTRAWEEVWYGGAKPWLVSVSDPCCQGETLWGHGVGMSATGALYMASRNQSDYQSILQYYYRSTILKKAY